MIGKVVPSTEFQTRTGRYLDEAGKAPVFITKYDRPVRVLLDIDEYKRLKRNDNARLVSELSDADYAAIFGGPTREILDHMTVPVLMSH